METKTVLKGKGAGLMNSGYCGEWMSKRAAEAIRNDIKPKRLWGVKKLVKAIMRENPGLDRGLLEAMGEEALKDTFLEYSEWHHMGKDFKKVAFYKVSGGHTNGELPATA